MTDFGDYPVGTFPEGEFKSSGIGFAQKRSGATCSEKNSAMAKGRSFPWRTSARGDYEKEMIVSKTGASSPQEENSPFGKSLMLKRSRMLGKSGYERKKALSGNRFWDIDPQGGGDVIRLGKGGGKLDGLYFYRGACCDSQTSAGERPNEKSSREEWPGVGRRRYIRKSRRRGRRKRRQAWRRLHSFMERETRTQSEFERGKYADADEANQIRRGERGDKARSYPKRG